MAGFYQVGISLAGFYVASVYGVLFPLGDGLIQ